MSDLEDLKLALKLQNLNFKKPKNMEDNEKKVFFGNAFKLGTELGSLRL